jgi:hypothetical protein
VMGCFDIMFQRKLLAMPKPVAAFVVILKKFDDKNSNLILTLIHSDTLWRFMRIPLFHNNYSNILKINKWKPTNHFQLMQKLAP